MRCLNLFGSLTLLAAFGQAVAEPSSRVAWTPETLSFVKGGDAQKGRELAQTCDACHGVTPANEATEFPYLSGQLATYLYKQLQDYKNGSRANEIMAGIAAGLTDQAMADVAAWYSRQAPPAPSGGGAASGVTELVQRGDGKRILPPCAICHGSAGGGERMDTPSLAGQKAAYLEQTLLAYKTGARANDIYHRMRLISQQLSEQEIRALARYYAGLGR